MSEVTPAIQAEAAAWIARLHGPARSRGVEAGLRAWLAASAAHARAFEETTRAWEAVGCVPAERLSSVVRWDRVGSRRRRHRGRLAIAAATGAVCLLVGWHVFDRAGRLSTDVGEQRAQTLADGSRIQLNTASRLVVRYGERERRIELLHGEALFEVSPRPNWPFVVQAGDKTVRALGTSFIVRREPESVAVTLVEGKVAVESEGTDRQILSPGERITYREAEPELVDRPALDSFTAWQRGQMVLDGVPLRDAVAEMNRYSTVPVRIEAVSAGKLRVSGVFRIGDSRGFARAVASTYQLRIEDAGESIVLVGEPHATYSPVTPPR